MKLLLLVGGIVGWGVGMGSSFIQGNPWPSSLWRGCLAAYITALLMRWWGRAWRKSLDLAILERERIQQETPPPPVTSPKVSRS